MRTLDCEVGRCWSWDCSRFERDCITGEPGSRKSGRARSRRTEELESGADEKQVLRFAQDDKVDFGRADVAQLVEHSLGKGEVISSILIIGSRRLSRDAARRDSGCGEDAASRVSTGIR